MKCIHCGTSITARKAVGVDSKQYIAINSDGTYGSYVCFKDGKLEVFGHKPEEL